MSRGIRDDRMTQDDNGVASRSSCIGHKGRGASADAVRVMRHLSQNTTMIIHDKRLPKEYKKALEYKLPGCYLVPFGVLYPKVYDSISCHPDIYFFQIDDATLIHAPCVSGEQLSVFEEGGIKLVKGQNDPNGSYPETAPYNAVRVGDIIFHKLDHTDPVILEQGRKAGLKFVNIDQGYARCSVVAVTEKAIITPDGGIAKVARDEGIDVLLISRASIVLPGEKYGFLGGASGKTTDGTIVFLGDINLHPDASKIKDFLQKHQSSYICLESLPLYDLGSLIIFQPLTKT